MLLPGTRYFIPPHQNIPPLPILTPPHPLPPPSPHHPLFTPSNSAFVNLPPPVVFFSFFFFVFFVFVFGTKVAPRLSSRPVLRRFTRICFVPHCFPLSFLFFSVDQLSTAQPSPFLPLASHPSAYFLGLPFFFYPPLGLLLFYVEETFPTWTQNRRQSFGFQPVSFRHSVSQNGLPFDLCLSLFFPLGGFVKFPSNASFFIPLPFPRFDRFSILPLSSVLRRCCGQGGACRLRHFFSHGLVLLSTGVSHSCSRQIFIRPLT